MVVCCYFLLPLWILCWDVCCWDISRSFPDFFTKYVDVMQCSMSLMVSFKILWTMQRILVILVIGIFVKSEIISLLTSVSCSFMVSIWVCWWSVWSSSYISLYILLLAELSMLYCYVVYKSLLIKCSASFVYDGLNRAMLIFCNMWFTVFMFRLWLTCKNFV